MPAIAPCAPTCCTTPQVVNIPGVEGSQGTPGTNGVNAYSFTSASFVIPAVNATVTVSALNTTWMGVGELVFISDGVTFATFQVTAIGSSTQFTAKFLGYPLDASAGATILLGAIVTPSGQRPSSFAPQTAYGSGAVYELIVTDALLNVGTNPPTLTLTGTGTYLLFGTATVNLQSATCANESVNIHLRRTNNTPADIAPTQLNLLPAGATLTQAVGVLSLPAVAYAGTTGDIIQLWGNIGVQISNFAAGVHTVRVTQTGILAIRLF
jgi:hypothetical protein